MGVHSQYKQDAFLETLVFKGFKNGTFMDVGAHDGISLNNTLFFEETHGWTGCNVEPLPDVFIKLEDNRPKCINIEGAIANRNGSMLFYKNTGYTEMLSGLVDYYDPRHKERLKQENWEHGEKTEVIEVATYTIESICDKYGLRHIHYLSVDVEGAELAALQSIDFDKVYIDVIGFENNYTDTSREIVDYLKGQGFVKILVSTDIFMMHINSQFYDAELVED
jgi:FkbM family methyltransferase